MSFLMLLFVLFLYPYFVAKVTHGHCNHDLSVSFMEIYSVHEHDTFSYFLSVIYTILMSLYGHFGMCMCSLVISC